MRILTGILVMMIGCCGVFAEQTEKEAADMTALVEALQKHVRLGTVKESNERDDQRAKWEVIETETEQDKDSPFIGTLRFTCEFTDKEKNVYFGQASVKQKAHDKDYIGKEDWRFKVPHGDLVYPKLTAYAMEFGFETNGTFVVVDQIVKKVKTGDEIMARNKDNDKKLKVSGIVLKTYTETNQ